MPATDSPVNALITALDVSLSNATVPTREPSAVGRLLVRCQGCAHWDDRLGCQRMDRLAWCDLLILPGDPCGLFSPRP